jgi:pteridine reductase
MDSLEGKVVLVTGGARRVGAAIARRLHKSGAILMLHYRSSVADARKLQAELEATRAKSVSLLQGDLLDTAKLPHLIAHTVQTLGKLDGLINNASTFLPTPVGEINEDNWHSLIGTNVKAPLFLAQAAAPHLRKTQGSIINITDIHADLPMKNYVVYTLAKAALQGLTRSLARELAPEVRVNAIAPGPILWPDGNAFDELARQRIISHTPLKRVGSPDDIAGAVHYLLTDAGFVTGHTLAVDGGRRIAIS